MASAPSIETPRLRLEVFSKRHLTSRYVGWLNDPSVTRFSEQRHLRHTLESCQRYWESFQDTPHYFWAAELREGGLGHIGNLNAYVDPVHGVADVGILLGETAAHGQGYGTEAWLGVCDFLLRLGGIRKVSAGALANNLPMLAIMKKAGMIDDGRRIRHCLWNGEEVDVVHTALFRDDWIQSHPWGPFAK